MNINPMQKEEDPPSRISLRAQATSELRKLIRGTCDVSAAAKLDAASIIAKNRPEDGFFQIHAQTVGDRGTYRCGRTMRVKWPCLSCSAVPLPRLIALPTKRPRLSVKVVALPCVRAVPANAP
jgi:hypothetical protein